MLDGIERKRLAVGMKQSIRAVNGDQAESLLYARDTDPGLLDDLLAECARKQIPVTAVDTMAQLGRSVGIDVGSAVVAVLKRTL